MPPAFGPTRLPRLLADVAPVPPHADTEETGRDERLEHSDVQGRLPCVDPILRGPVSGSRAGRPSGSDRHSDDQQTWPVVHGGSGGPWTDAPLGAAKPNHEILERSDLGCASGFEVESSTVGGILLVAARMNRPCSVGGCSDGGSRDADVPGQCFADLGPRGAEVAVHPDRTVDQRDQKDDDMIAHAVLAEVFSPGPVDA